VKNLEVEILNLEIRDTIAAISTPYGTGAIAVVRMSGPQSLHIVSKSLAKGVKTERKMEYRNFLTAMES